MNHRTLATIVLSLAIIAFSYWVYIPIMVLCAAVFPFYFEAVIFGFVIDVLYGSRAYASLSFFFPFALLSALLVIILLPVRQYLRLNHA